MNKVISYLWQLPQNICGLLYKAVINSNLISEIETEDSRRVKAKVWIKNTKGGVTLGKYIFVCQDYTNKELAIKHECGHVKQSKILGPLYLIVIGIPSILHAWLNDYIDCDKDKGYSHFYTEDWANKLMGIC